MTKTSKKLTAKILIKGQIETLTGLHIGGSKSALDIGGIDLNVIKTPQGVPFIPGSSIKGKLRSLLAKLAGSVAVSHTKETKEKNLKTDEDYPFMLQIFGSSGDNKDEDKSETTRLLVRDADLDTEHFKSIFLEDEVVLETDYTDAKWENTINRLKGTAEHPRQLERVPVGAKFNFEMVYDVYDDDTKDDHLNKIILAMKLLENDYLGGSGSRGYGKVRFCNVEFIEKSIENYTLNEGSKLDKGNFAKCEIL